MGALGVHVRMAGATEDELSAGRRSLGRGFASNLIGVATVAVVQLAFTPFFLRCVGIAGYGFIGFFVTLQAVLQVFDFGFAPTIARWMARFVAGEEGETATRDLARTLEVSTYVVAVTVGAALAALAIPFGRMWFAHAHMPAGELQVILILMACTITVQWPTAFYQSGLLGLQRPEAMNAVRSAAAILATGGAAVVLIYVRQTVGAYFAVQIAVAVLNVVVLRVLFWRAVSPSGETGRFRPDVLRAAKGFAAGMTGITLCGVLVTQVDRILLSRLVPLESFGYYALAWVIAGGVALVVVPAHNTLFPRFSALFSRRADGELRIQYHRGAQILSVLLLPLASVVALFAGPLIRAWTGDARIAAHTAPIAVLLVIGSAMNGLMHPPYALQLASGSTRLPFVLTVGQLLVMVPAVAILALRYGILGAALAWPAMNLLYLAVGSVATHRLWLPGAQREWLISDIARPLEGALLPVVLARMFVPIPVDRAASVLVLGAIFAASLAASALAAPATRAMVAPSIMAAGKE